MNPNEEIVEEVDPCTLVRVIVTRYPAPEDGEDYAPDGEVEEEREEEWGEDSLALEMRWMDPSQWPVMDPEMVWFTSDAAQDFRTGEYSETAYFLSPNATDEHKRVWVNAVSRAAERRNNNV